MPHAAPAESDPIVRFLQTLERAESRGIDTAPAALATADAEGRASIRLVLVRGVDARGFVFFTNYESRKARDMQSRPWAALCYHWVPLEEQVRIEGPVERVSEEESDAYFATRPRGSQIGAWASQQSAVLGSRAELERRYQECVERFGDGPVPRPPFWGGYRLAPQHMEFWYGRLDRLHDRIAYERTADGWQVTLLFP